MDNAGPSTGFDFSNILRNAHIENASSKSHTRLPKATSTGTTIVGVIYDGGVALAADTRATEGPIVADKNCEKIHYISDNIKCAGAGTAADTEFTTAMISSNMQLHALSTNRQPRVVTALTMLKQMLFRYQGQVGAYLVLGGFDIDGPQLYTVAAHGSTDKLPYVTMGSGSMAAMSVFETRWRAKMTRQEAIDLVVDAIESGIFNDLGSGSNVDVCCIEKDGSDMYRNYKKPNERVLKELSYKPRKGATAVKKFDVKTLVVHEEELKNLDTTAAHATAMEVDA